MDKNLMFNITAILLSMGTLSTVVYKNFHSPKVAFVRSKELFDGYTGTKEAKTKYTNTSTEMTANLDTLNKQFNLALSDYNSSYSKLSSKEKEERKQMLVYQKQNLDKYNQILESKIADEDQKLAQGVLNQVNTFISEYGKKRGYSIIFGTNLTGNIIYGDNAYDLTEEVLLELNNNYKKGIQK